MLFRSPKLQARVISLKPEDEPFDKWFKSKLESLVAQEGGPRLKALGRTVPLDNRANEGEIPNLLRREFVMAAGSNGPKNPDGATGPEGKVTIRGEGKGK